MLYVLLLKLVMN